MKPCTYWDWSTSLSTMARKCLIHNTQFGYLERCPNEQQESQTSDKAIGADDGR